MITNEDREFVNFLFGKLVAETDTDMIDLHDDDTAGIDQFEFSEITEVDETKSNQLSLFQDLGLPNELHS